MPRIQDHILNCVIYLYPSREQAMKGEKIGGSGFLLCVPTEILPAPAAFIYAVTNKHVIDLGGTCVRLNMKGGDMEVLEYAKPDWTISEEDDLAIRLMPDISDTHDIHSIPLESLISKEFIKQHDVGVGDEVMIIGRFINVEGIQQNSPTARFGHIAQMPGDPIEGQEGFLIEVRSIGGFSGSPVYIIPNTNYGRRGTALPVDKASILGVDFCHITRWFSPRDDKGDTIRHIRMPENTGMAGVVPAWKLERLVNSQAEKAKRRAAEEAEQARRPQSLDPR